MSRREGPPLIEEDLRAGLRKLPEFNHLNRAAASGEFSGPAVSARNASRGMSQS